MRKPSLFITSIIVLSLVFGGKSDGAAMDPYIEDLRLSEGVDQVLLSASLAAEFDEEMRQAIRGGVPLKFRYKIRLTPVPVR